MTVLLGSMWMFTLVFKAQSRWNPSYLLTDGVPESLCNCVEVLRGNADEIEKTKLISIRKDFRKRVRVPDDFYVNATQDCKYVMLNLYAPFSKEKCLFNNLNQLFYFIL